MTHILVNHRALERFLEELHRLSDTPSLSTLQKCEAISGHLVQLIENDSWLPARLRRPSPVQYQRHLVYEDPQQRFSVGSFVWAPHQITPIHDHRSWGVIGALQTGVEAVNYVHAPNGGHGLVESSRGRLLPGQTTYVAAEIGDIHTVGNPTDQIAITIHVYGCAFGEVCKTLY